MTIERGLRLIAGVVVLASVLLAVVHDVRWAVLTALVGLNLLQSAFTDWCPMVSFLARLGLRPCLPVDRPSARR